MLPLTATRSQTMLRWLCLCVATVLAALIVRCQVSSRAETFWLIFPLWLLVGSWGLRLFPFPRLNARSRGSRYTIMAVLMAFPIVFYGGLVYLTNSVWSSSELAICMYFFTFSLECFLLVFFAGCSAIERYLQSRLKPPWRQCAFVLQKLAAYAILIPFLLVTFAVHRPKLIPRPLTPGEVQPIDSISFLARDGLRLRGIFLPHPKAAGTIIVCHGVGANHADIKHLFLNLYSAGFQILAFDFRGHGNSDGYTITYGLLERSDVLGAYDYCLRRPDVLDKPLFALAVSMGGASLLQALPEMPRIHAAVVDSAFASLELMAEHQLRFFPKPVRTPLAQMVRGVAWIEIGADLRHLAPADRLRDIHIPLLIIHGSDDHVVPVEHAYQLQAAATGPVELVIEPGAPHIGSSMLDPAKYVKRVKQHFLNGVR